MHGIKVAKPSKDISSSDPRDFTIHSQYNTFKIAFEGGGSIDVNTGLSLTIEHNLGYKPQVFFYFRHPDSERWVLAPCANDENTTGGSTIRRITGWAANDDDNNTTLHVEADPFTSSSGDVEYRYFIMIEPREDAWYE